MKTFFTIIFAFYCVAVVRGEASKNNVSRWVLASNFDTHELDGLTPLQEHELQLKHLAQMNEVPLGITFLLEMMATSFGNAFFGLTSSETAYRENEAILQAAFECFTKLEFQKRIQGYLDNAVHKAAPYLKETGDLGAAFSKVCSKMDEDLKNETFYTTARDEFKKQSKSATPAKIYQYGIAKSEEALRKAFAELANEPQMKKFTAHATFAFFVRMEESIIQKAILELAREPTKREVVQKIYEKSTEEILPLVKDVSAEQIDLEFPVNMNVRELRPILSEKLVSKIDANPDLKTEFETIKKRVHDEFFAFP